MSQYVVVKFALINRTEWYGAMTTDSGEWVSRPTGAIFASTPARLRELIAGKANGTTPHNPANFAGFLPMDGAVGGGTAPKAPKAPAPKPATPFMDAARRAASTQAKAVKADAPRTPAQTAHWLRLCLDYGNATLQGEMAGDLVKRSKAVTTAFMSYLNSCAFYGKEVDHAYGEAATALCAAIDKRLAAG
jgi:hypothetical protein